ncbi:MAG: YaaA family protein, partial [Verrucomicrobiota bacterium]|nr:YaaA family protein [Verrucomicrobiota bacterium]
MIILLSPAKTLDFETPSPLELCTEPDFLPLSKDLISGLAKLSSEEIGALMGISTKLAELNRERYQSWRFKHDSKSSKQAILAFKGDVYEGLQAWNFKKGDFNYAQKSLRILSGLYGILRPLDLIQPHRLEMGTAYCNPS